MQPSNLNLSNIPGNPLYQKDHKIDSSLRGNPAIQRCSWSQAARPGTKLEPCWTLKSPRLKPPLYSRPQEHA